MIETGTPDEQPELEPTPPAPEPDPAPEPAPVKRTRRAADEPADPHAGHAVYDETLTRYVSEVFRGSSSEADAKSRAAELKKSAGKGSKFTVRPV